MSEQGMNGIVTTPAVPADWREVEALGLLEGLQRLSEWVTGAVAAAGDIEDVIAQWEDAPLRHGVDALAAVFGSTRGALQTFGERWELPRDMMAAAERQSASYLTARSQTAFEGPPWCRPETAMLLDAITAATYAVAATVAVGGELGRVAVPVNVEDTEVAGEEWLAETFGRLRGALGAVVASWGLPASVMEAEAEALVAWLASKRAEDGQGSTTDV